MKEEHHPFWRNLTQGWTDSVFVLYLFRMPDLPTVNPFRDLYDAAVRYPGIKLTCRRCRHSAIFSTHALWYHFDRKGWRDDFRQVQRRCVCLVCWFHNGAKARNPDLEFVNEAPTDTRFPQPPEFTWKQQQRRRR